MCDHVCTTWWLPCKETNIPSTCVMNIILSVFPFIYQSIHEYIYSVNQVCSTNIDVWILYVICRLDHAFSYVANRTQLATVYMFHPGKGGEEMKKREG